MQATRPSAARALAVACAGFCTFGAEAAEREWKLEPAITLRTEFHDRNAAVENAKWAIEIDPSIAMKYASGEGSLNLRYSPRLVFTDLAEQRSDVVHSLAAQGRYQTSGKRLVFDANALIGEQARDPLSPLLSGSLPTGERLRTFSTGVGVTARDNVFSGVLGEVRANYQITDTSLVNASTTSSTLSPRSNRWTVGADLKSSLRRPPFGWSVGTEYSQRSGTTADAEDTKSYKAFVGAEWNPSAQLGYGVIAGFEQSDFVTSGSDLRGAYGDIYANWRPNARIEANAKVGAHFYGLGYELGVKWREPRTVFELTARRAVVTAQESVFLPASDSPLGLLDRFLTPTISDATLRAAEVQRLSSVLGIPATLPDGRFFFSDRSMLENFVRVSALYSLPRITFNASAQFRELEPSKSEVASLAGDSLRALQEWGVSGGASYRLSQTSSLRAEVTADSVRSSADQRRANRLKSQIGLTQQWSRAISTGVIMFYDKVESDNVQSDYDDKGLSAFVRYQFN